VGNGKLIMAGVDLQSDLENRPEGKQLLYSLKSYMTNNKFNPTVEVKASEIRDLFSILK
jgi:hypothetical protein